VRRHEEPAVAMDCGAERVARRVGPAQRHGVKARLGGGVAGHQPGTGR
jgi:hypothetical protein